MRSTKRLTPGEASSSPRSRQPASGKRRSSSARKALSSSAGAVGDAIEAIDQAPRLDQPRLRQARLGDHQTGTEEKGPGAAIGLPGDDGAKLVGQLAHGDPVAELHAQAIQHLRIGDGAPDAIMLGQGRLQRSRRRQLHVAGQGIGAIHRLHLHQLARRAIGGARHGAEAVDGADLARRREGLHLQGICRLVEQADLDIPAQQDAGVAGEPGLHRFGHRPHPGDQGGTQCQAEEEQAESGNAAAQLAPRQPPGQRQPQARRRPDRGFSLGGCGHRGAGPAGGSARPEPGHG